MAWLEAGLRADANALDLHFHGVNLDRCVILQNEGHLVDKVLADGADVEAFKTTRESEANLRWNICTAAEEMVCENVGNTVFFLMCPMSLEG
jgi:hypothetical protein